MDRFLHSQTGEIIYVQMPYDDYVRLDQEGLEAGLFNARLKQVAAILAASPAPAEMTVAAPAAPAASQPVPRAAPPEPEVAKPVQAVAETRVSREAPVVQPAQIARTLDTETVVIPPVLQNFLNEEDPSQHVRSLVETCVRRLSGLCGKRITLSLHKPYICLWDFDAWVTFAYGEIKSGEFYLSVEESRVPDAGVSDIWTPPSGLSKKPLVRIKVDTVTDSLISLLQSIVANDEMGLKQAGA